MLLTKKISTLNIIFMSISEITRSVLLVKSIDMIDINLLGLVKIYLVSPEKPTSKFFTTQRKSNFH